jgi:hypothetical protein
MIGLNDEELAMVSALAEKQVSLEVRIAKGEELLKSLKKELDEVRDKELPNALAECGLSEIKLTDGTKITVKQEVYASITEEKAPMAFGWLREHDHGALIKNVISTEFGKGEDEKAVEAATVLAEAGFRPTQKESVHPMTLKAFLKEQINKGEEIPLDLFSAHIVNRSKIVK